MAEHVDSLITILFKLTGHYAWIAFAVCAMAFLLGTITMIWHIVETQSRRYVWWLVASGVLMTTGFALGGMQAGDSPVVSRDIMIPWVRLIWFAGGGIGLIFLCLYWFRRIQIVPRNTRGKTPLSSETYG